MNLTNGQHMYADLGTPNGEGQCATKYLMYRKLVVQIPTRIARLMSEYDEDFVASIRSELSREQRLEIKEDIDDYLGEVQTRVIERLDAVTEMVKLKKYSSIDLFEVIQTMNQVPIEDRITQLLNKTFNEKT